MWAEVRARTGSQNRQTITLESFAAVCKQNSKIESIPMQFLMILARRGHGPERIYTRIPVPFTAAAPAPSKIKGAAFARIQIPAGRSTCRRVSRLSLSGPLSIARTRWTIKIKLIEIMYRPSLICKRRRIRLHRRACRTTKLLR